MHIGCEDLAEYFCPFIFKSIFMEVEVAKPQVFSAAKEEIISIVEECQKSQDECEGVCEDQRYP